MLISNLLDLDVSTHDRLKVVARHWVAQPQRRYFSKMKEQPLFNVADRRAVRHFDFRGKYDFHTYPAISWLYGTEFTMSAPVQLCVNLLIVVFDTIRLFLFGIIPQVPFAF